MNSLFRFTLLRFLEYRICSNVLLLKRKRKFINSTLFTYKYRFSDYSITEYDFNYFLCPNF